MVTVAAIVGAAAAWALLFLPPREGFWRRALVASVVLAGASAAVLASAGELDDTFAGASTVEVVAGGLLAVVAYAAVRVGYPLVHRFAPWATSAVDDVFALRRYATAWTVAGVAIVLGTAEELLFRGIVQDRAGLAVAVAAYAGIQLVSRNWFVLLLGVVGGTVWGLLALVTGSIVPGLICHVLPIAAIAIAPPADVARRYPLDTPPV